MLFFTVIHKVRRVFRIVAFGPVIGASRALPQKIFKKIVAKMGNQGAVSRWLHTWYAFTRGGAMEFSAVGFEEAKLFLT